MLHRSKFAVLICCLQALLPGSARADIAPNPMAGGASMINRSQDSNVAMNSETVDMNITKTQCLVKVLFHMRNTGRAEELEVGFPCNYEGELKGFCAKVDGWPVAVKYDRQGRYRPPVLPPGVAPAPPPAPPQKRAFKTPHPFQELGCQGWKTWQMFFADKAQHTVEVSYQNELHPRIPHVKEPSSKAYVRYILRTGAFWKGPISKATINVNFDEAPICGLLEARPFGWQIRGNTATLVKTNFEPDEDVHLVFDTSVQSIEQAEDELKHDLRDSHNLLSARRLFNFYVLHFDSNRALKYAGEKLNERLHSHFNDAEHVDIGDILFGEDLVASCADRPGFQAVARQLLALCAIKLHPHIDQATYGERVKRIESACRRVLAKAPPAQAAKAPLIGMQRVD